MAKAPYEFRRNLKIQKSDNDAFYFYHSHFNEIERSATISLRALSILLFTIPCLTFNYLTNATRGDRVYA